MDEKLTSNANTVTRDGQPPVAPMDMPTQQLERLREPKASGIFSRIFMRHA